jgi:hypothetical protein
MVHRRAAWLHFVDVIEVGVLRLTYYLIKIAVTTVLIVAISEIAKRSSFVGALLASVPLISVLAITWLYVDTKDMAKVSALATSVFWLVLPSLAFFVTLPLLIRQGLHFYLSVSISVGVTVACYWLMVTALGHYGIRL